MCACERETKSESMGGSHECGDTVYYECVCEATTMMEKKRGRRKRADERKRRQRNSWGGIHTAQRTLSPEQKWVRCHYGDQHPIEGGDNRCFGKTNDFMSIEAHYYSYHVLQFDATSNNEKNVRTNKLRGERYIIRQ